MDERYIVSVMSEDEQREVYAGNVEWDTVTIIWEDAEDFAGLFTIDEVAILEKYYDDLFVEPVD